MINSSTVFDPTNSAHQNIISNIRANYAKSKYARYSPLSNDYSDEDIWTVYIEYNWEDVHDLDLGLIEAGDDAINYVLYYDRLAYGP